MGDRFNGPVWDFAPVVEPASTRVVRGFSRIGIGCAILAGLCGVAVTVILAVEDARRVPGFDPSQPYEVVSDDGPPKGFMVDPTKGPLAATDPLLIEYLTSTPSPSPVVNRFVPGEASRKFDEAVLKFDDLVPKAERVSDEWRIVCPILVGLGLTLAVCLVVFGFFRGLGWVLAGFARS
jgi:hypothetical protein